MLQINQLPVADEKEGVGLQKMAQLIQLFFHQVMIAVGQFDQGTYKILLAKEYMVLLYLLLTLRRGYGYGFFFHGYMI